MGQPDEPTAPTILLVGTADTKSDELAFLRERLQALGAQALLMDVGVLAAGQVPVDDRECTRSPQPPAARCRR